MRLLPFLAVPLALAIALVPPARAQARPDSLVTRFDWPVGMRAIVHFERARARSVPGRTSDTTRFAASYRVQVAAHAEGRLVSVDSLTVLAVPRAPDAPPTELPAELVASMQPSYVVSDAGAFVRVANIARMKAFIDTMIAERTRTTTSRLAESQRAALAGLVSEQALSAVAAEQWNAVVDLWADEDWVVGKRYRSSAETPVPMLPGFQILLHSTIAAEARVACTVGGDPRGCVRLRMTSRPDSAGLRRFFTEMGRMVQAPPDIDIGAMMRDAQLDTEVVLVTEPTSLRPHDVRITRRVRFDVPSSPREPGGRVSTYDEQHYRYTY
ncbi:MAG TPA: hypothetical protein VEA99_03955 [Gemmatimonadaceae bacterium]|nr:hypothetical protein [Gemmatimonadaceae bacterium]